MAAATYIPIAGLHEAARAAQAPVCMGVGGVCTWVDFTRLISGLAGCFAGRAAAAILACEDPLHFLAALFALWQCGRTPVVPPNFKPATLERLSTHHDGAAIVDDGTLREQVRRSAPFPFRQLVATDCGIALYTSGSSGEPKRIDKTLAQLDAEIATLERFWGRDIGGCGVLASVPHHHIYGLLFRLLWPIAAGRPFDRDTCADPERLRESIDRCPDHVLVSSPSHLARFPHLMDLDDWRPRPRLLFSSGAPLPAESAAMYRMVFGKAPVEVFGSTETGGVAWRCRDGGPDEDRWATLPGVSVSREADGALRLSSPFLPETQWRMEDAIGLHADGRFSLLGRLDRIVKLEGKRLALPEMERCLQEHPWVKQAALIRLPGSSRLGAVVVADSAGQIALDTHGQAAAIQVLREHIRPRFEAVLLPRRFRFVTELPVNDSGKLTETALQSLFEGANETDA